MHVASRPEVGQPTQSAQMLGFQGNRLFRCGAVAALLMLQSVAWGEDPYAGVEACARCHKAETRAWRASPHGKHATPMDAAPAGADGAVGSGWMQAYIRRDGRGYHRIMPECRDVRAASLRDVVEVLNEIRGAWPGVPPAPPAALGARSFEIDCSGCHSSQSTLRIDPATGYMDSKWKDLAINCETCHGAGAAHSKAWEKLSAARPLVRLEKLSPRAANAVCGRCHGGPPTPGEFEPSDAELFIGVLDDREGFYPDGTPSGQVYQYASFVRSPCYADGGLMCTDCHDAHGPGLRRQEHPDAMCTRCHEEYATRKHTFHDPRGEGARCIECHMPKVLGGIMAHQRDHRIGSPLPATPHAPDACTACHKDKDKAWASEAYRKWWGDPPQETLDAIRGIHLARRNDPAATALLKRARSHRDPFFRANAAIYLRNAGRAASDPVPEVRLAAVRAAAAGPEPLRHLLDLSQDREPRIRAHAIVALIERGQPVDPAWRDDLAVGARHVRDYPTANLVLGVLDLGDGRVLAARRHFQGVLAVKPRSADAWLGLATALEQSEESALARHAHLRRADVMREALLLTPWNVQLAIGTANAYRSGGKSDRAREVLLRVQPHLRTESARQRARTALRNLREEGE